MRLTKFTKPVNAAGFTLVELLIVMTFTVMFSGLIMMFFLDLWNSTTTLENDSQTLTGRQDAGDSLRNIFNTASGLVNQNDLTDTGTLNPDPSDPTGTHWIPLHAIPGTISMPATGTQPIVYFIAPSTTSTKQIILNGSQPYQDNFVLYLNATDKTLRLHTVANAAAPGNRLRTTCPDKQVSSSCLADMSVINDVQSVSLRYFSRSGNTIDWTSIKDPLTGANIGPDFPSVEVIELTLNISRKSVIHGGSGSTSQTIIRVAFRNG